MALTIKATCISIYVDAVMVDIVCCINNIHFIYPLSLKY